MNSWIELTVYSSAHYGRSPSRYEFCGFQSNVLRMESVFDICLDCRDGKEMQEICPSLMWGSVPMDVSVINKVNGCGGAIVSLSSQLLPFCRGSMHQLLLQLYSVVFAHFSVRDPVLR